MIISNIDEPEHDLIISTSRFRRIKIINCLTNDIILDKNTIFTSKEDKEARKDLEELAELEREHGRK